MTDARLAEIEALAAKATPGPWKKRGPSTGHGYSDDGGDYAIIADGNIVGETFYKVRAGVTSDALANAQFIAHARSDIPDLLAEIARLRAELGARDATITGLRAALTFYARSGNYYRPSQMAGETSHSAIENDCGDKARAALATPDSGALAVLASAVNLCAIREHGRSEHDEHGGNGALEAAVAAWKKGTPAGGADANG